MWWHDPVFWLLVSNSGLLLALGSVHRRLRRVEATYVVLDIREIEGQTLSCAALLGERANDSRRSQPALLDEEGWN